MDAIKASTQKENNRPGSSHGTGWENVVQTISNPGSTFTSFMSTSRLAPSTSFSPTTRERSVLSISTPKRRFYSNPHTLPQQPSAPGSPELEAMLQQPESFLDLDLVNQALKEIRQTPSSPDKHDDRKEAYIARLSALASNISCRRERCRVLLTEALRARDQGKPECCRALCLEIIRNPYADEVPIKVYAYNILSTLASPGQAEGFLYHATRFLMDCDKVMGARGYQALLDVVELLREGAKKREARARRLERIDEEFGECAASRGTRRGRNDKKTHAEPVDDGQTITNRQRLRVSDAAVDSKDSTTGRDENRGYNSMLKLPKRGLDRPDTDKSALMTPRTEKIIEWAFESGKARMS